MKKFLVFTLIFLVNILIAQALIPGQIMMDPNNNAWMVYNKDDNNDGKLDPFFMCGVGEPEEFLYTEGTSYVQANDVINKIKGTGANAVYFQLIRTGGDVRSGQPSKQDPFINNNPSTSGANKALIQSWKSKWFNSMEQNGIVMYVFFYDDTVSIGKNNEMFFRDVVNELEGYKNLIWIVGEESREALGDSDVNRIAGWIRKYDDNNHPVGNHQLEGTSFNTPDLDTFAIQMNTGDIHSKMVDAWNKANGRYNLVMSESKLSFNMDTVALRRFHWASAMGGAYITELDWWYHGEKNRAPSTNALRNCGNLVKFMESTRFNEMSPQDSLKNGDTKYVLANPSSGLYIAYTDNYNSNLGIKGIGSGTYDLIWYDITNNNYVTQNGVSVSGGDQTWSRPSGISGNEVALYITGDSTSPPQGYCGDGQCVDETCSSCPQDCGDCPPGNNQIPIAYNSVVETPVNTQVYVQLVHDDSDGPGPYTFIITQYPSHGSLTPQGGSGGNDWNYMPNTGFEGTDSVKWKVNDGLADSTIATVTILIGSMLEGDADGNGEVDLLDLILVAKNFQSTNFDPRADLNNDNKVDLMDLILVAKNYGNSQTTVCGDNKCGPGEDYNNCPQDCSQTAVCGDNTCDDGETCSSCSQDCGDCPPSGNTPLKIATGAYPDVAVDSNRDAHIVYANSGKLWYIKYDASANSFSNAQDVGISQQASYRNDPDVEVDSQNRPHVIGGTGNGGGQYAYFNGNIWVKTGSFNRDTALAIDSNNNAYVVQRGNDGAFINVYKRSSSSSSFTKLSNPQVSARNDHVYTDIATSPVDDSVHIVYRHGSPSCSYLYSTNGGSSWMQIGVSDDDAEAPFIHVADDGTVYAVCGAGGAYKKSGSSWQSLGSAVTAGTRRLPVLSTDSQGNLYASAFGGRYNVRKSSWSGQKTVNSISGKSLGFMRVAGSSNFAYAVWEEGNSNPENDNSADNFDIVFGKISSDGVVS